jgi:histone H2B
MAPKAAEAEQKAAKTKAEKKPVGKAKAEKKPVSKEGGKKKKNKKSTETYKIYIYKVLKQVICPFPDPYSVFRSVVFLSIFWYLYC